MLIGPLEGVPSAQDVVVPVSGVDIRVISKGPATHVGLPVENGGEEVKFKAYVPFVSVNVRLLGT